MDNPRQALHPILWVAAASVTALSLAGIAKLTGVLPSTATKPPEPIVQSAPPPLVSSEAPTKMPAPAEAPKPLAAAPEPIARPAPAENPHPPEHKPAAKKASPPKPHPLVKAQPSPDMPAPPPGQPTLADVPPPPAPPICRDCGVIEDIRAQEVKGEGTGLGAIGGALLGGVLGHQVGEGSGKQLARIGGAVLGGFAGNEVERRERASTRYEITVRLDDGTRRVIVSSQAPAWREGQRVRVRSGELLPAPPLGSAAY